MRYPHKCAAVKAAHLFFMEGTKIKSNPKEIVNLR
jgi:hypothetical protein